MPLSPRSIARVALLAAALVALPAAAASADPATQPVTTGPAATTPDAPEPNLWQLGDAITTRLENQYQTHREVYLDRSHVSIRGNAMMLELHSLAALQGHVGPARQDARIPGLVELLSNAPVYVTNTNTHRTVGNFPHVPAFEASYQANSPGATLHPSADAIVVRALTVAWRARYIVNLPEADILRIQQVLHDVAHGPFYRSGNRAENQINWNADVYAADLEVNHDTTILNAYRSQLKWFADHAHKKTTRYGTSNLSRGEGFHYLPQHSDSNTANKVDTSEYSNLVHSALGFYGTALKAGMRPLGKGEVTELRRWSNHIVYGTWTDTGYLNWDSGLGTARRHIRQYWAFSLDALIKSSGPGSLLGTPRQRGIVRYIAERGVALYLATGWNGTGAFGASTSFGAPNGFPDSTRSPLTTPLRFAVLSALLDDRLGGVKATPPGNIYSDDTDLGRIAVSTVAYNTAILRPAGLLEGGLEPTRLFDGAQRPLTALGGNSAVSPGVRLAKGGLRLLDTQPATLNNGPVPTMHVSRGQTNTSGTFKTLTATGTIRGAGAAVSVTQLFERRGISTTYRIKHGRATTATLRMPVWGIDSKIEFLAGVGTAGERLTRRGSHAIVMRMTTPDDAQMVVSLKGVPAAARIVISADHSNPKIPSGARTVRIRFRLRHNVTIHRRIGIVAAQR